MSEEQMPDDAPGTDDRMRDEDPDEELSVPDREVRAALALADRLIIALSAREGLAEDVASGLPPLPYPAQVPEVGRVEDGMALRAYLQRIAERIRPLVPDAPAAGRGITASQQAQTESGEAQAAPLPLSRADIVQMEYGDLASAVVWWDDIRASDLVVYRQVLDAADDEKPLQRHLASNPLLLVQSLRGGQGRWVGSQKRLGSEYVTDFVIGERSSGGFEWQFVELQSPRARLFVPSTGRLSPQFDEGIRQIQEWRRWLDDNRDYARRSRSRNGLGLRDVSGRDPGLLLIGRETDLDDNDRQRRR